MVVDFENLLFEWWCLIIMVFKDMAPHGDLILLIENVEDGKNEKIL
jgi:hypothetical protein